MEEGYERSRSMHVMNTGTARDHRQCERENTCLCLTRDEVAAQEAKTNAYLLVR